jgi:hypothetical protein
MHPVDDRAYRRLSPQLRHWIGILSRFGAAILGGYALAYAVTALLSLVLPLSRTEAVIAASLPSFGIHVAAAVWAFAARTPFRAWAVIVAPAAACGVIVLLVRFGAGT